MRDSQVVAIRVGDPEISQAPWLHLNIIVQLPALLDDMVSLCRPDRPLRERSQRLFGGCRYVTFSPKVSLLESGSAAR